MSYDELEKFDDRFREDGFEKVEPENPGDGLSEIDTYDNDYGDIGWYYDEPDEDELVAFADVEDDTCQTCDSTGEFPIGHICKSCGGSGHTGA